MDFREFQIVDSTLQSVIDQQTFAKLQAMLTTAETYRQFCKKLVEICIGQEKSITLSDFFSLHGLETQTTLFEIEIPPILEEIAEQYFKFGNSEYSQYLMDSKNEVFLNHLQFLKDTNQAFSRTERETHVKRFSERNTLHSFHLTEEEIKTAFTFLERKRLKKRLEAWNANKKNILIPKTKSFQKRKMAGVFALLFLSSLIFAFGIPAVRNYIIQKAKIIFHFTDQTKADTQTAKPGLIKNRIAPDYIDSNLMSPADTCIRSVLSSTSNAKSKEVTKHTSTQKRKIRIRSNRDLKTQKDLEQYFKENAAGLEKIEGIWNFSGIFSKEYQGYNATKIKFAILKTDTLYEMIWLNKDGSKNNYSSHFYLYRVSKQPDLYLLKEFDQQIQRTQTTVHFDKSKGLLLFEIDLPADRFSLPGSNPTDLIHCHFSGKKIPNQDF